MFLKVKGGALAVVTFDPIKPWIAGAVGKMVFTLPSSIEPSSWHWIAFYRVKKKLKESMIFIFNKISSIRNTIPPLANTYLTFGSLKSLYQDDQDRTK